MPGGLIDLKFTGDANMYLNNNPQITFFKTVYKRYSNFSMEYIELPFNVNRDLNMENTVTNTCKITRNGDLVHDTYLVFDLPAIYSVNKVPFKWVDSLGTKLIESISLNINGQSISRIRGEFLRVYNTLSKSKIKNKAYNKLINSEYNRTFADITNNGLDDTNYPYIPAQRLYIPLDFWFCKNIGMSLPLIAMQYSEVTIEVEFAKINDLFKLGSPLISPYEMFNDSTPLSTENTTYRTLLENLSPVSYDRTTVFNYFTPVWNQNYHILSNYIFVENTEQKIFAQTSHDYLIKQYIYKYQDGLTRGSNNLINLDFTNVISELIWFLKKENRVETNDWYNFTCIDNNHKLLDHDNEIKEYITSLNGMNTLNNNMLLNDDIVDLTTINTDVYNMLKTQYDTLYTDDESIDLISTAKWDYYSIMESAQIIFNGNARFETKRNKFFENLQVYKYHSGEPIRGVYNYSFSIEPEKDQPTGGVNLSMINNPQLSIKIFDTEIYENKLDKFELHLYAVKYNVFRIMSGIGQIVFSN